MPAAKPKVERVCQTCGTVFRLCPSQAIDGKGKFCSRACQGKGSRHGCLLYCALCDSPFYRRYGEQDVGVRVRQFCSRPCYSQWRLMRASPDTYLKDGAVHVHRLVAEEILGRKLTADEVVHHIDNDKHNNAPENLAVFPGQSEHARCHFGKMSAAELDGYRLLTLKVGVIVNPYQEFLSRKAQVSGNGGFDPLWVPGFLFDFQHSLIEWAIRKGRAAVFADCGL